MAADNSAFICLPLAVRDSILRQAFHQLDQKHLFGVAPRVCQLWRQLSLSIITSLVAKVATVEAAEQFSLWMQNHGAGLDALDLYIDEPAPLPSVEAVRIMSGYRLPLDVPLHSLTSLTRLSITSYCYIAPTLESMLGLTRLESLSLIGSAFYHHMEHLLPQLATRLIKLTSLNLLDMNEGVRVAVLSHLCSLPDLKELLVWITPDSKLSLMERLPITGACFKVNGEPQLGNINACLGDALGRMQEFHLENYSYRTPLLLAWAHGLSLHQATQLKSLRMCGAQPDMLQVAALTQLTVLSLSRCGLDDAAVCKLSSLCSLQVLDLSGNDGVLGADGSMEVLASSLPHLRGIMLVGTSAHEAAQLAFGQRFVWDPEHIHLSLNSLPEAAVPPENVLC